MPDWTYQTVFRPLLFRMAPRRAQQLAIGSLGRLGSFWLGRRIINFMGHMVPDHALAFAANKIQFPSRVGLGCGLDSSGCAVGGLNQFGLACLEYGPFGANLEDHAEVEFQPGEQEIRLARPEANPGLSWLQKIERQETDEQATPLLIRFCDSLTLDEIKSGIRSSDQTAAGFVIPLSHWEPIATWVRSELPNFAGHLLILAGADDEPNELPHDELLDGVRIDGSLSAGRDGRVMSGACLPATLQSTKSWRQFFTARDRPECFIAAGGGIHQPMDSHRVIEAGADIALIDSGFVVSGPGLAKRCNELLAQTIFQDSRNQAGGSESADTVARQSWFWSFLMGIAMLGGGLLALAIALTRVVLPYDESVVGMTREELYSINDRLLDFMAHDRVTLAGSMLSVGTLYVCLSWFGSRQHAHWAEKSIVVSAFVGFFSFFLFLGFGDFDPFHAFVTTILFQFLLLTLYARLSPRRPPIRLDLLDDAAWRSAQWGQLMHVIHGAVLIVAGTVICKIGITQVFIKEDLEFLCTTPDKLISANPQLLSLVAHDRATFGGMLVCTGITVLLASMWGFRRGHAWLWWMLLIGGCAGYVCAIYIHHRVGYTDFKHLLPAYGGLIWLGVSSASCYQFLHDRIAEFPTANRLKP